MSLKEQDRATLVVLGLEKSEKMLDAANWLIEEKHWSLAANRLYYALFHAVKALLTSDAHPTGTHRGASNLFYLHYVKTGIFSLEENKVYARLQQLRDDGDYNCVIDVDKEDVEDFIEPTRALIEKIKSILPRNRRSSRVRGDA